VESIHLTEFYRSLTTWPKSRADLVSVVEKIGHLLQVPFVALSDEEDHIVFRFFPSTEGGEGLEELIKAQLRRSEERTNGISSDPFLRQVQISRDTAQLMKLPPGTQLSIAMIPRAPISVDERFGLASSRRKPESGWIMVSSAKALAPKEEVLLLAVAQRLSELSAIARLEGALQLRSQFLSIASHELKTPLTSIYGILQLQERLQKLAKKDGKSYVKILIRQVQRLNELIDGLLDVSRIQNGRFMVEPSETDVAQILNETLTTRLNMIAQENGVTLNADIPERLVSMVDPIRMEEVISNLVMNAIRFSPEGGVVWIKLRDEGNAFRLTVRDQGPSVPVEDRDRIFQPFERAQRTSRLGGLGLGLFISRQIAQLHGGNVSLIESVPGKGNVFEAYFPDMTAGVRTTTQSASA
jgi:signal transduction histidine kinase